MPHTHGRTLKRVWCCYELSIAADHAGTTAVFTTDDQEKFIEMLKTDHKQCLKNILCEA